MIQNPIPWPDGKRCAVAFTFDMDAESLMHLYFHDTAPNRVGMGAMLRYDAEIAVPRLLALLRRYGLRQTSSCPAGAWSATLGRWRRSWPTATSSATTVTCTRS